ncbi:MAG: response regulator transcription factor [Acidobacteriota bacterium]
MMSAGRQARDIRVWLVEDNDLLRDSVRAVIEGTEGMGCPVAAASCEEALAALREDESPDLVLMDIGLPGIDGIEGVRRIRSRSPATRIVMLTVHEESDKIFEAICAGASGYLLKPSSMRQIVQAVRDIEQGAAPINGYIARKMLDLFGRLAPPPPPQQAYGLTPREREILQLLVDGLTMRQIAERLHVSYHTVDTHVRHVYDKLHVRSRTGAVTKALQEQLLGKPAPNPENSG